MRIYITGPSCSGKSSVSDILSGGCFCDLDTEVEKAAGMSVEDIFKIHGEAEFRRIESLALKEADKDIVATGGGTVMADENLAYMRETGVIICLTASPEKLLERLAKNYTRPLLEGDAESKLKKMLFLRAYAYCSADHVVDTTELSLNQAVEKLRGLIC